MSGLEIVERMVRGGTFIVLVMMFWLMQGGEDLIVTPNPISGFLIHVLIFFFLAGAFLVGWNDNARRIAVALVALALVLEAGQMLFPARTFSMFDLAGNVVGVGLGVVFFTTLRRFSRTIGS